MSAIDELERWRPCFRFFLFYRMDFERTLGLQLVLTFMVYFRMFV